mmetsp:Transcript_2075/g.6181  ORF Transcript_2075/g.6181 Transcript_2075/m.6181 type:complete len:259 (+) Transcript_2075:109-885(+)
MSDHAEVTHKTTAAQDAPSTARPAEAPLVGVPADIPEHIEFVEEDPLQPSFDYLLKFLLVGDSGVGKTSIVKRFSHNDYTASFISTIGVDFEIRSFVYRDRQIKLQVWDTAGQERFQCITHGYYRGGHGVLIVYDCTDEASIERVWTHWLAEVERYARPGIPVLVVGNKTDLKHLRKYDAEDRLAERMRARGIPVVHTSAKEGTNVTKAVMSMVGMMLDKRLRDLEHDESMRKGVVPLGQRIRGGGEPGPVMKCCTLM